MVLKISILGLVAAVCSLSSLVAGGRSKYNGPKDVGTWRKHHPYHHPPKDRRRKVTIRASVNSTDDISAEFYAGLKKANYGGTLVLPANKTFVIGKKLDLTFLNDVQVQLDGEILFTDNITYWQHDYFYHPFQKSITFWKWGGKDIKIFGSGVFNGNGQAWYDGFAGKEILDPTNTYYRPILFYAENATRLHVEGISMINSPVWHNFIVTSKDVSFANVVVEAKSTNKNLPKNSDGWDTYNVDGFSVTDSWINNGDDCISPKANTSNILIQNIWCNGSHGISMGSIGQYPGVKDIIENAWVENITMLNSENGARIKTWAGPKIGYGYVKNITFVDFYSENTDWPIILDACYFNINASTCAQYPSRVNITDIKFLNFTGSSSGKEGNYVADLSCSPEAVCDNIVLEDINLKVGGPNGTAGQVICSGIAGGVGVPCGPAAE